MPRRMTIEVKSDPFLPKPLRPLQLDVLEQLKSSKGFAALYLKRLRQSVIKQR